MSEITTDVWKYATAKVNNKGVFSRIAHSSRFHGFRSAVNSKGSFGSKALGALTAVGRASLGLIPIPVIGSLIATAQSAIEGKVRSHLHQKHTDGKTASADPDFVKFSLKEASVENLDRYRFKVEHAVAECNKALMAWGTIKAAAEDSGERCKAKVELAMAIEQANRRMDIFDKSLLELETLMRVSRDWSLQLRASLATGTQSAKDEFTALYQAEQDILNRAGTTEAKAAATTAMLGYHSNCGDFCVARGASINTTWDSIRSNLATATREITSPFSNDSLLALNKASFASADQTENY